jgi:hypothetical protein
MPRNQKKLSPETANEINKFKALWKNFEHDYDCSNDAFEETAQIIGGDTKTFENFVAVLKEQATTRVDFDTYVNYLLKFLTDPKIDPEKIEIFLDTNGQKSLAVGLHTIYCVSNNISPVLKKLSLDGQVKFFKAINEILEELLNRPPEPRNYNTDWYTKAIAKNPEAKKFTVSSPEDLAGLAQIVNGTAKYRRGKKIKADDFFRKTVILNRDIDLSSYAADEGWIPIGDYASNNKMFSGTFNGVGYIINNLTIDRPGKDYQGLFGYIKSGWVGNFGLNDVNIKGASAIGSVAGYINDSIVTKIHTTGIVCGTGEDVGGIVGSVNPELSIRRSLYYSSP